MDIKRILLGILLLAFFISKKVKYMDKLKNLLNRASFEERKALAEILKASQPTVDSIVDRLCEKSQDTASYVFNEIFDDHPSYQKIVRRSAKKLNIKCSKYESASAMEVKIAQKVMETMLEKMSYEKQHQNLIKEVNY